LPFAPTIRPRTATNKSRPAIWAMVDNGEARIKRVERPTDSTMLLLSDNPDYSPEMLSGPHLANIKIVGKVVWWGHTNRD
jgi:phage repressor protein C with HTH and peptisase S24 domain